MNRNIIFLIILIITSLSMPLNGQNQTVVTRGGYFDIVETTNPYDQEFERQEQEKQKVVFSAFANIVQNLFCIVQNPKNPTNVANNVAGIIAGIVSTGMTITRNRPTDQTIEERQQFINEFMTALEQELQITLHTVE